MANLSVEKLATVIGSAPDLLLSQMKEAGLTHSDLSDEVTDSDKIILLGFGSGQQHDRRQQKLHVLRFTSALRADELRAASCECRCRVLCPICTATSKTLAVYWLEPYRKTYHTARYTPLQ